MTTESTIAPEDATDGNDFGSETQISVSEMPYIAKIKSLHQLQRSFEFLSETYQYRITSLVNLFSTVLASNDARIVRRGRIESERQFQFVKVLVENLDALGLFGEERRKREDEIMEILLSLNIELHKKYFAWFRDGVSWESRRIVDVSIYLGGNSDEKDASKVLDALRKLADLVGVYEFHEVEKVVGSIFKRFIAIFRSNKTREEIDSLYSDGKESLRQQFLNKPRSETSKNFSEAAATLVAAVSPYENAILRVNELIIVKQTINGIANIAIETISSELAKKLEEDPELLKNPGKLISMIPSECVTRTKADLTAATPSKF